MPSRTVCLFAYEPKRPVGPRWRWSALRPSPTVPLRASPAALPILVLAALLTATLMLSLVTSPPAFDTDLDRFAPNSDALEAHDRIHEHFPEERRPMFVHVVADDGSNVLTLDHLKAMEADEARLRQAPPTATTWSWRGPLHPPPCRLRWTRRPTERRCRRFKTGQRSWRWCSRMTSPAP